jgi:5,10-methylenetetrahydrofolate reductase
MRFAESLASGGFPIALEITPPQRSLPAVLLRRAALLDPIASAVNVIQRPQRQPSLDASIELAAHGRDPVWHLVTRGEQREAIKSSLARAAEAGIRQVLCIRGDHAAADAPGGVTIRATIAMARDMLPGALLGATLNQYAPDGAAAMRNLCAKLEAGASYVQTQPIFDVTALQPTVSALRDRFPGARVVGMVMPLRSAAQAEGIGARLAIPPPSDFAGESEEESWAAFGRLLAELAASRIVDGLAVMTFEMDPAPESGAHICQALRAAGLG